MLAFDRFQYCFNSGDASLLLIFYSSSVKNSAVLRGFSGVSQVPFR